MNRKKVLALCECAIIIALAVIFDYLSKIISSFFPNPWVNGGGITIAMVPLIFISYLFWWPHFRYPHCNLLSSRWAGNIGAYYRDH